MSEIIRKEEVEDLLGYKITTGQFEEALEYARRKQRYIFETEKRPEVFRRWYLVKLTEEYVGNLAFSKFSMDLCRMLQMEKEHSAISQSAHSDNHIVADTAL